jgi:hypothetical protein
MTPDEAAGPRIRLVDATVLTVPGSRGTDWRVHAVFDPVRARLCSVQVTDAHGGEHLRRGGYETGDLVMADRGLARARGLAAVAAREAYSLVRMHWQNIRLQDAAGEPLESDGVLTRADRGDTGTNVIVPVKGEVSLKARLLTRRLPPDRAERARDQLRRNAAKKQRSPSTVALRLAGYFSLLTTLPADLAPDDAVLEFYRVRWQIELFFKRAKSLLRLNELRADDPDLVQAYCLSKLIQVALSELLATEGEAFSPWGVPRRRKPATESVANHPSQPHQPHNPHL